MIRYRPYKIVLIYGVFSAAWIYGSDTLLNAIGSYNLVDISGLQTGKGLLFVVITSIMLYQLIKKQQSGITASEKQYKTIFFANPNPMWIYNIDTLKFIEVNDVAQIKYGYTKSAFLDMTIHDILSSDEQSRLNKALKERYEDYTFSGYFEHLKKSGEKIIVSIESHKIVFNDQPCVITMASDVTERLKQDEKIKGQNKILREIAWQNSHAIRKPLCNLLSIINILKSGSINDMEEFLPLLSDSATELDENIKGLGTRINNLEDSY